MSAESQPEILPAFIGSGFRRAPPRSSMSVVIPSPGNSPTFGGFGGEVLAHTRNGPSSAASSTLYPSDLWMPSVASKGEDTLWRSEGSGFRRRERPCEPHVLSGCSAKWKYCGCDLPALNFSTTLPVTDTINIGSWNGSDQSCTPSCLLDTFTPLPPGPKVSRVQLTNIWAAPDNRPFPVAEYLANLQTTLSNLELFKMYLPTITRDSFAGFVALWRLVILHSHVSAIDINAFATVGDRPGSALPQLWSLTISHNNIATLDWSVFAPLMSSVKFIELENDNIQRIVRSRSYVVHSLESVRIVGNPNLTSIDDRFLRSVSSASRPPVLDLTDSPICSDSARCQRIAEIHGPIYCCWAAAQKQTPR
ncbi:uncharacterized protein LOC129583031 [Paramacrobiotus metropolitanus]|uniref:uncharacterized protein LOC129583031 n=1 Tax=Paramacrobiotus metropolitanus TaxID=2943436 RepID=UPI0024464A13|nr:uncharacterized protein LOC129583031 [Paramacrobiotus metropolitanus]